MDAFGTFAKGGLGGTEDTRNQTHSYATRNGGLAQDDHHSAQDQHSVKANTSRSPAKKDSKHVVFVLIDSQNPQIQARLPLRVMISRNDTTESIISTVKNFYGLYDYGVGFEDKDGNSIIAAHHNFDNDMTVYVRTTVPPPPPPRADKARDSASPNKPQLGAPFEGRASSFNANNSPSRSAARSLGVRSVSPQSDVGRRSASAAPGSKPRPQRTKSKDNTGDGDGYSSGADENASVTSSRRSKAEEIKADITVDNIVEGGRRKRAFESSELPLFVPPQVPMTASISSISPQRKSGPPNMASPYGFPNQQTFSYTQPLPSPQSYANSSSYMQQAAFPANPYQSGYQQPNRQLRGGRSSGASLASNRHSNGGILPTPDPTIGSVISDEDVALQLMRLGDPTAFSHGRTSTSTVDDSLSGKAEAASSDEEDEDDDDDEDDDRRLADLPRYSKEDIGPQRKKQRLQNELPSDGTSGEEYDDQRDGTFISEDGAGESGQRRAGKQKSKARNSAGPIGSKSGKPRALSMSKAKKTSMGSSKMPMSPASLPSQSRKASNASTINFQHQLGADEEDLSSKPRCQRCRKSKKGCDRQRPCGRCKDAGIGIDGCVSEDEGNGRKGRYGRHMGVTIKKAEEGIPDHESPPPSQVPTPSTGLFLAPALPDKIKKRKR